MKEKLVELSAALRPVRSGSTVALGGSLLRRQPNAAIRELIRHGVRDLTVQTWAATTAVDMLAAAGALRRYEGIYVGMFSHGLAPNFRRAVEAGEIEVRDFSETAMVARFRAASAGLEFMPLKTLLGSDIARLNPEQFREMRCPFSGAPLHAVAAAKSDFTVIHGYVGDKYGNVQWPIVRDTDDIDQMIASSAKRLIVTVEKIVPHEEICRRPTLTYIPGNWVEAIVEVPYGAHPAACDAYYDEDEARLADYLAKSRTAEGARAWLDEYVHAPSTHAAYVEKMGGLAALRALDVKRQGDAS
jgi:glutaconate CoA-transferase, subunit A